MTIIAAITTSVDGYITGPNDGPDKGLGEGGERLHYWVFGGPWSYASEPRGEPTGEFTFVGTFEEATDRAKQAAGAKDVSIGGGASVIRQGLDAGIVDELHIIVAPVILGGGKHLFEDFTKSLDLENLGVQQSPWATFMRFAVKR